MCTNVGHHVIVIDNLFCICSPNFLILDEPTNHLDVETVEALGKALTQFNVSLFVKIPLRKNLMLLLHLSCHFCVAEDSDRE